MDLAWLVRCRQKASVTDRAQGAPGHTTTMDYYDDADPDPGRRGNVIYVRDTRYATTGK